MQLHTKRKEDGFLSNVIPNLCVLPAGRAKIPEMAIKLIVPLSDTEIGKRLSIPRGSMPLCQKQRTIVSPGQ